MLPAAHPQQGTASLCQLLGTDRKGLGWRQK